jgi:hypothetical protein
MPLTNYPNGLSSFGIPVLGGAGIPFTSKNSKYFFVDPVNGLDGNTGLNPGKALKTLYKAISLCTSGNNDVVYLIGNGAASGTARLSLALAQSVDPSATSGTLVWNKNATHLIGITAPTQVGQRARIAPPTGTYTQATFGSGNFVTVSGAGCMFANVSLFHGFSTGGNSQICWTDTGGRNYYFNMDMGGAGDAASAQSTSSRSLLISGQGENTFVNCKFGLDTVTRTVANATLEFAAGTARNKFQGCVFPFQTSASTPLGIITAAAASMDRWQWFEDCAFINNVQSTSTTMAGLSTLAASSGGLILMRSSSLVGITEFGTDATSRGQVYIDGGTVTAATSGIAVNPT